MIKVGEVFVKRFQAAEWQRCLWVVKPMSENGISYSVQQN